MLLVTGMALSLLFSLALPVLSFLTLGMLPHGTEAETARKKGKWTVLFCVLTLLVSVLAAVQVISTGPLNLTIPVQPHPSYLSVGFYLDSISVVMMALVSFIGLIIARYSMRYLDGDPHQGRFFRWMSFTIGTTLLLVISSNLVMLTVAWMLTSYGLHQLLTYYPERPWAVWAARKKFLISRLGDAFLIAAVYLSYQTFGTTEYAALFAAANELQSSGNPSSSLTMTLIGLLTVLGAMTKSAQFPFHSWLPETMETPTPVSALMHAGVINAGGFLVIRLSPLVALSPLALDLLTLIGAITALLASVVMLTQTSIKRSLAYSTIAQMGFMMLQCGLGAFSAALLHIVAHSAYKSHAFLSCGSVLDHAKQIKMPAQRSNSIARSTASFTVAVAVGIGIVFGTFYVLGVDILHKPGGPILGLILTLSLSQLIWNGLLTGDLQISLQSLLSALIVSVLYSVAFIGMDWLVAGSTAHQPDTLSPRAVPVFILVSVGFAGIFTLQSLLGRYAHRRWLKVFYVHAMNDFYLDIPARWITARIYGRSNPIQ